MNTWFLDDKSEELVEEPQYAVGSKIILRVLHSTLLNNLSLGRGFRLWKMLIFKQFGD